MCAGLWHAGGSARARLGRRRNRTRARAWVARGWVRAVQSRRPPASARRLFRAALRAGGLGASDGALAESAAAWMELLRAAAQAEEKFPGITSAEWWELALEFYSEEKQTEDRPADAVELLGWLELLWEDAPHLVVAGLNDGR